MWIFGTCRESFRTAPRVIFVTMTAFAIANIARAQELVPPKPAQISDKKITIAFLLPETSSPRYEQVDRPEFLKMVSAIAPNAKVIVSNANSSPNAQLNQAQSAITNGAQVLVVDPVDGKAAATIVTYAAQNGVPVIAYDRLIQNAKLAAYVSFDSEKIGQLQGLHLAEQTKPGGTVIMINGAPTDPNAFKFRAGALSVLDPLFKSGKLKLGYTVMTPAWSAKNAFSAVQQALTKLDNRVDGVLAANDPIASGAIRALQTVGLAGKVPVTGQDATDNGLTSILAGLQSMTVFRYVPLEAAAAAQLAVAIGTGAPMPTDLINSKVWNGAAHVPSVLLMPVTVTADSIADTVVKSGYTTWATICVGAAASTPPCTANHHEIARTSDGSK